MSDRPQTIELPATIAAFLVDRIENRWIGEGRDARAVIEGLPPSLPAGQVQRLLSGGPFGWMMDARVDEIHGQVVLEVLEDDRMAGPERYRVWEDGSREALDSESTGVVLPSDCSPAEAQRIEDAHHAHNRAVAEELENRGFRRRPEAGDS